MYKQLIIDAIFQHVVPHGIFNPGNILIDYKCFLFLSAKYGLSVVQRDATTTVPVRPTEISRVLACRLFIKIDQSAADQIAEAYMEMYKRSGAQLPDSAIRDDYKNSISANYPFHPSFIAYLTHKLASAESFQGTRGVLRVLAMAIGTIWQQRINIPLIHTCHLNMANLDLADELIGRTGANDLLTVLNADVGGADSGNLEMGSSVAQNLDRNNPHPQGVLWKNPQKCSF